MNIFSFINFKYNKQNILKIGKIKDLKLNMILYMFKLHLDIILNKVRA